MERSDFGFKHGLAAGMQKGWSGFIWMLKILVPVSFLTSLLAYTGWISKMDFLLEPVMGWLYLPPMAALPLIIGMLTGIYGAIASMLVLPLTTDQMTLIAVFLLISHNLIQEGIVQGKSGIHPLKVTLFRLVASVFTVLIVAQFLDSQSPVLVAQTTSFSTPPSLRLMLKNWFLETSYLALKIFAIIMVLMIFLELLKIAGVIHRIVNGLVPVLKTLGLDRRVGILWLTAAVFGVAYGAAVIVEEAKEGGIAREDLTKLHLSIGINHALIEDPALFLPLGLSPFWLWVPRLITAIVAVHLLLLWHRLREGRPVWAPEKSAQADV